jgi:hypothetical protein
MTTTVESLREAARDHCRQALADGTAPSGAELGRHFGMSARWGSARAREVNAGTGTPGTAHSVPASPPSLAAPAAGMPAASAALPPGTEVAGRRVRAVIRWVTTAAVVVVAACAARASYDHQRRFVDMAGETEAAWHLPLSVDGMMLLASLNMLVRRWDNQPAGWLTWCALTIGGIASLAANIAAAEPTLIGRAVAAWPPICLLVSYELLMQQLPTRQPEATLVVASPGP